MCGVCVWARCVWASNRERRIRICIRLCCYSHLILVRGDRIGNLLKCKSFWDWIGRFCSVLFCPLSTEHLHGSLNSECIYLWCCRCILYRCLRLGWIRCVRQFDGSNTARLYIVLWCTHIENLHKNKIGNIQFQSNFLLFRFFSSALNFYLIDFIMNACAEHMCESFKNGFKCSLLNSLNNWLLQCNRETEQQKHVQHYGFSNASFMISCLHFTFYAWELRKEEKKYKPCHARIFMMRNKLAKYIHRCVTTYFVPFFFSNTRKVFIVFSYLSRRLLFDSFEIQSQVSWTSNLLANKKLRDQNRAIILCVCMFFSPLKWTILMENVKVE